MRVVYVRLSGANYHPTVRGEWNLDTGVVTGVDGGPIRFNDLSTPAVITEIHVLDEEGCLLATQPIDKSMWPGDTLVLDLQLDLHVLRRSGQDYDIGYKDGEASAHADWAIALSYELPDEVPCIPSAVALYIEQLRSDPWV